MRGDAFTLVPTDGESEEPAEPRHDRLVSIPETQARLADITRRQVYNLIKGGDLRAKKIGRRVGIYESSIAAYIDRCPDVVVPV